MFLCCLEARKNKRVMKVPKGTSDYQATWIVDEDDGENGDMNEESSEEDDDDDDMLDEAMEGEDEDNNSQVHVWRTFVIFIITQSFTHDKQNLLTNNTFAGERSLFSKYDGTSFLITSWSFEKSL